MTCVNGCQECKQFIDPTNAELPIEPINEEKTKSARNSSNNSLAKSGPISQLWDNEKQESIWYNKNGKKDDFILNNILDFSIFFQLLPTHMSSLFFSVIGEISINFYQQHVFPTFLVLAKEKNMYTKLIGVIREIGLETHLAIDCDEKAIELLALSKKDYFNVEFSLSSTFFISFLFFFIFHIFSYFIFQILQYLKKKHKKLHYA